MPTVSHEAPVSMNCFVEVEGLGRVQVTARGATGTEAARSLQASVRALVAPTALEPASDTLNGRLVALVAKGTLKALGTGDMALVERLHKALVIAATGGVSGPDEDGIWYVASQAEANRAYTIQEHRCSCPDAKRHYLNGEVKYCCKHSLSQAMVEKATAL